MGVWLTSDPHFGHKLAAEDRGFDSVEEHDRHLFLTFRRMVEEEDDVWWLGDMAFDGWENRLPLVFLNLPGRHHVVLGNHDRPHPLHSQAQNYQQRFMQCGFLSVQLAGKVSYDGKRALLSHFPYAGDHDGREDRFSEWRLRDTGRPLIHGHTHGREQLTYSPAGTPQLHVGLDAWGLRPVTLSDAFKVLGSA